MFENMPDDLKTPDRDRATTLPSRGYNQAVSEATTVNRKAMLLAVAMLGSGHLVVTGQTAPGVFTSAQAEAGRTAYENTCGKCHTSTLLGRKGEKGELPPVSSLSAAYQ